MNLLEYAMKKLGTNLGETHEIQTKRNIIRERKENIEKRIVELNLEFELLQKENEVLFKRILELNGD